VFIGHFESDGRDELLEYLLASGINLRVYGPGWNRAANHGLLQQQHIRPIIGEDYVRTLSGAAVALVLLSKRNRDLYTTRCFEIPACKTVMLAPRTSVLQEMYCENKEAVFYEGREELLEKLRFLLSHGSERDKIAEAGYRRCITDRNSNIDRAREIIADIESLISTRPQATTSVAVAP
jgi:spore maturation protein CgeB